MKLKMLVWAAAGLLIAGAALPMSEARAQQRSDGFVTLSQLFQNFQRPAVRNEPPAARQQTRQQSGAHARREVAYKTSKPVGSIVVETRERALYYVLGNGRAIRYAIGVGREGFQWSGSHKITRKAEWPTWTPPAEMRKRQPGLPVQMAGGPNNPLGARALYIGNTLYRIHGTNDPNSIGRAMSSGCIRMMNHDIIDLYNRTKIGARVYVYH
jgi:lipoprotein-anchoring transpeptidase ErfK/SrfK